MEALRFELPYPPSVNRAWRTVPVARTPGSRRGFRVVMSREGRAYRREACARLAALGRPGLTGPLRITITLHPPDRRKRDADNAMKAVLDSLQHGGVVLDDAQFVDQRVRMGEPVRGGRADIEITEPGADP